MHRLTVKRLTIYPLSLRMKRQVAHAASQRAVSEPIVAAVELMNGIVGYGETLPRPYVTGETNASVLSRLREEFTKELLAFRPASFPEALEAIDALPMLSETGEVCAAARAAVELALLDGVLTMAGRSVGDVAGWMGLPGFGQPGSVRTARYSMVLASASRAAVRRNARLARLAGMREFKLKVGFEDDDARVRDVVGVLGRALARGRARLRLDANGAWTLPEAVAALGRWRGYPIAGVEQPLAKGSAGQLAELRAATGARIFHDESLVTMEDAERLHGLGVADGFNIRLSKCGGMMPALRLAAFARARGIAVQLGCMVGETSILSAAGLRFLEVTPGVEFCEGSFGSLLLAEDVTGRSLRFGWGGRAPRVAGDRWGAGVREDLLRSRCASRPEVIEL